MLTYGAASGPDTAKDQTNEGSVSLSDLIGLGGVVANLILALVAIVVPVWQRRAMLGDARKVEQRSWNRFIEAFTELAAALDAIAAAGSASAFAAVEPRLRSAMDAFAISSANPLPVKAAINASRAQQMAAEALSHLPDLKSYGPNLFTYGVLKAKLQETSGETQEYLRQARLSGPTN